MRFIVESAGTRLSELQRQVEEHDDEKRKWEGDKVELENEGLCDRVMVSERSRDAIVLFSSGLIGSG